MAAIEITKSGGTPITPGGANTNVQYNDNGDFGGTSQFNFDGNNVAIGKTVGSKKLEVSSTDQCVATFGNNQTGAGITFTDDTTTDSETVGVGAFGDLLCLRGDGNTAGTIQIGNDFVNFRGNELRNSIPLIQSGGNLVITSANEDDYCGAVYRATSGTSITIDDSVREGFNMGVIQLTTDEIEFYATGDLIVRNREGHTQTAGQYAVVELIRVQGDLILSGDTAFTDFIGDYITRVLADGGTLESITCMSKFTPLEKTGSLVMMPIGYKESVVYTQKPNASLGDLSFTRSNDTATRVNSAGLIEKVRTNLILQSNSFDTTWVNSTSTETGGQAGYDGTNNAWLLETTGANGRLNQNVTASLCTISIYAKAGTIDFLRFQIVGPSDANAYFDLSNGTIGTTGADAIATTITSVGGGWYRCSMSTTSCTIVRVFPAQADNDTSGTSGNIFIQDAQLESGDIATDYIPTTTTAVSVGMTANVPRLDYSGGGCPKLLLEPQRTNLALYSEQFDNAAWQKTFGEIVTANAATSPDGMMTADRIDVSSNTLAGVIQIVTGGAGTYTFSVYAKKNLLSTGSTARIRVNYDSTNTQNEITLSDDWQRFTLTVSVSTSIEQIRFYNGSTDSVNNFDIWGAQLEAGSYVTSYIPTLAAAVTRGADACSKTGISSLIGQTSGTLFVEIDLNLAGSNVGYYALQVYDSAASPTFSKAAYIELYQGKVYGYVRNTTVQCEIISSTYADNTRLKIAIAYKANDFALYVNGVQIGTDASGSLPSVLNSLALHYSASSQQGSPLHQALLFPTRLTNTQLAELTTL